MPISSLNQEMSPETLHDLASTFSTVSDANLILGHPNCAEKTEQMVVAKLHLFDDNELQSIPQDYHPKIHEVVQKKFGGPTATATG